MSIDCVLAPYLALENLAPSLALVRNQIAARVDFRRGAPLVWHFVSCGDPLVHFLDMVSRVSFVNNETRRPMTSRLRI